MTRPGERFALVEWMLDGAVRVVRIVFALNRVWVPTTSGSPAHGAAPRKPDRLAERIDEALSEPDPTGHSSSYCSSSWTRSSWPRAARTSIARGYGSLTAWRSCGARCASGMRTLGPVSEDEVLHCFVRAERDSERYGETVRKLERRAGDNPRAVLSAYRSWPDQGLFYGFRRTSTGSARG